MCGNNNGICGCFGGNNLCWIIILILCSAIAAATSAAATTRATAAATTTAAAANQINRAPQSGRPHFVKNLISWFSLWERSDCQKTYP